jgi:chemotaxis protein CheD
MRTPAAALDAHDQRNNLRRIGIGEHLVSGRATDILATYGLGSCVAVLLHDPQQRVAGMIHCMLPNSRQNLAKAQARPSLFVDTGVTLLVRSLEKRGCKRENIEARLCGGGALGLMKDIYAIGATNIAVSRAKLAEFGIPIALQDVGGANSRTVMLQVGSGAAIIKSLGQTRSF